MLGLQEYVFCSIKVRINSLNCAPKLWGLQSISYTTEIALSNLHRHTHVTIIMDNNYIYMGGGVK